MGRWSHLDTDEERLPHGVKRIGYDADDQEYTFFDTSDGSIWIGGQYSPLKCISRPEQVVSSSDGSKDEPRNIPSGGVERRDTQRSSSSSPSTNALLSSFVAVGKLARLVVARRESTAGRRLPREERRRERRAREQAKERLLGDERGFERNEFDGDE
ncbi:hypothetical protein Daesc_005410 [Daldinia eschscholtzii]|uniref:Uncharacterized protein n=1 Tax=Daldinia eschscholtzii TaxID=292717 RepID=A0AAX6MKC0_9PEZI